MLAIQDPVYSDTGGRRTIGDESVGLTPPSNPAPNTVVMGQGERSIVTTVVLTAARTLALAPTTVYGAGTVLSVRDAHRACTSGNTLTLTLNGSDKYNNAGTSPVIAAAGGKVSIVTDGAGNWVDA